MSFDRIIAKTVRVGQRLSEALLGKETSSDPYDDSPMGTLRTVWGLPPDVAAPLDLYKKVAGPYAVDLHHGTFRDRRTAREVSLTVVYPMGVPDQASGFPVVVISPGLGAHPQATRYVERHLASHGYIVLSPTHGGSDWTAIFKRTPLGAFSQAELVTRVSEVGLALDLLESGRLPAPLLARANLDRAAMMGHSFGALTIQAVAGVPIRDSHGEEIPLANSRFSAFIGMSPYGDSFPAHRLGMTQEGYARIERPVLFMSGDRDDLWTLGRGPRTHLDPFRWVTTPDRYHLLIGNTRHADFSELLGHIKQRTAMMVNSTATAFLDAYLKEDENALGYLRRDLQVAASRNGSWAFVGAG